MSKKKAAARKPKTTHQAAPAAPGTTKASPGRGRATKTRGKAPRAAKRADRDTPMCPVCRGEGATTATGETSTVGDQGYRTFKCDECGGRFRVHDRTVPVAPPLVSERELLTAAADMRAAMEADAAAAGTLAAGSGIGAEPPKADIVDRHPPSPYAQDDPRTWGGGR